MYSGLVRRLVGWLRADGARALRSFKDAPSAPCRDEDRASIAIANPFWTAGGIGGFLTAPRPLLHEAGAADVDTKTPAPGAEGVLGATIANAHEEHHPTARVESFQAFGLATAADQLANLDLVTNAPPPAAGELPRAAGERDASAVLDIEFDAPGSGVRQPGLAQRLQHIRDTNRPVRSACPPSRTGLGSRLGSRTRPLPGTAFEPMKQRRIQRQPVSEADGSRRRLAA